MKLNIGCGRKLKNGYVNMDKRDYGQGIVRDMLRGIPFNDNTFDEVCAHHVLEHIPIGDDIYFIFSEVYRVLKDGGKFIFSMPSSKCDEAFLPDHKSFWNIKTVVFLLNEEYQNYGNYNYDIDKFEIRTIAYSNDELKPFEELTVILKKVKEKK